MIGRPIRIPGLHYAGKGIASAMVSLTLSGCALPNFLTMNAAKPDPLTTLSNRPVTKADRLDVAVMVAKEAKKQGVPVNLALAVARTESAFNPFALSPVGAMGVMQVMPGTARHLGHKGDTAELFKPEFNIPLGIAYLKQGYVEGGSRWAVLRYHGGPNRRAHGPKTRRYALVVLKRARTDPEGWLARGSTQIAMTDAASYMRFSPN